MLEYSGFILVNRNTLGTYIFVGCHRMSENSGVRVHKFHCIFSSYSVIMLLEFFSGFNFNTYRPSVSHGILKLNGHSVQ